MFGPAVIITGLFSLLFHASVTLFFQFFDFVGMFLIVNLLIVINLLRLKLISSANKNKYLLLLVIISCTSYISFVILKLPVQFVMLGFALIAIALEIKSKFNSKEIIIYKNYCISIFFLLIAGVMLFIDLNRIICDPTNHYLQGHALWHVFNSFTLWFLYKFYEQFDLSS